MSGKEGGVYAIAKIITDPNETEEFEEEKKYWLSRSKETSRVMRVQLQVIKRLINSPLFRKELKAIEELKELSILKFAQGTNFPVTIDEWQVMSNLITNRNIKK